MAELRPDAARPSDAERMAELYGQCFAKAWSEAAMRRLLEDPLVLGFVSMDPGARALAGFLVLRACAGEAEILTLAVAAPYRRAGLATALVEAAQVALASEGTQRLLLEVGADNAAARALYQGLGFREAGRRKAYYGGEGGGAAREDAIIMAKDLVGRHVPAAL